MKTLPPNWDNQVLEEMKEFATKHGAVYAKPQHVLYALFEIGCFHALVRLYEDRGCIVTAQNLDEQGCYRYLTTPNGNPHNFSYASVTTDDQKFEIRQQVRIISHVNDDIAFTPDLIVMQAGAEIISEKDTDYANGKRQFFRVRSKHVIAAHECKSLAPFPELLVSFVGSLVTGHEWLSTQNWREWVKDGALHPAPTLFAGGSARPLQLRMIKALQAVFPMNVVTGLHSGIAKFAKDVQIFIAPPNSCTEIVFT